MNDRIISIDLLFNPRDRSSDDFNIDGARDQLNRADALQRLISLGVSADRANVALDDASKRGSAAVADDDSHAAALARRDAARAKISASLKND
jgi:hypothetical protein